MGVAKTHRKCKKPRSGSYGIKLQPGRNAADNGSSTEPNRGAAGLLSLGSELVPATRGTRLTPVKKASLDPGPELLGGGVIFQGTSAATPKEGGRKKNNVNGGRTSGDMCLSR